MMALSLDIILQFEFENMANCCLTLAIQATNYIIKLQLQITRYKVLQIMVSQII